MGVLSVLGGAAALFGGRSSRSRAPAAPVAPQEPKDPDLELLRRNNARQYGRGQGSTVLTGAQGLSPSTQNVGRTTLLGG